MGCDGAFIEFTANKDLHIYSTADSKDIDFTIDEAGAFGATEMVRFNGAYFHAIGGRRRCYHNRG